MVRANDNGPEERRVNTPTDDTEYGGTETRGEGHEHPGGHGHGGHGNHAHWHESEGTDPGATWSERYAQGAWSIEPDSELKRLVEGLTPGTAVDLGAGNGRNAVWLAQGGWSVTCVDASPVGLEQAAQRAETLGTHITIEVADLRTWEPGQRRFDLVVVANIHLPVAERAWLFRAAQEAVSPGGRLFVIGHHVDAFGSHGPPDVGRLFTEELLSELIDQLDLDELKTVHHEADYGHEGVDVIAWAHRPLA
jgi:SAM-dependent methyltransferase